MTPVGRGGEERRDGGGKPLLGKPNLRGAQNAEAILRTYHRSRLRPPSSSPSRPPPFRPLLLLLLLLPVEERVEANGDERTGGFPASHPLVYTSLSPRYSPTTLSSSSDTATLLLSFPCIYPLLQPYLRHKNGRLVHLEAAAGLLKNALAPSAAPPAPGDLSIRASLGGESVLDLENARYPARAPGRGSSNRYPRIHRASAVFPCACSVCV